VADNPELLQKRIWWWCWRTFSRKFWKGSIHHNSSRNTNIYQ